MLGDDRACVLQSTDPTYAFLFLHVVPHSTIDKFLGWIGMDLANG